MLNYRVIARMSLNCPSIGGNSAKCSSKPPLEGGQNECPKQPYRAVSFCIDAAEHAQGQSDYSESVDLGCLTCGLVNGLEGLVSENLDHPGATYGGTRCCATKARTLLRRNGYRIRTNAEKNECGRILNREVARHRCCASARYGN